MRAALPLLVAVPRFAPDAAQSSVSRFLPDLKPTLENGIEPEAALMLHLPGKQ